MNDCLVKRMTDFGFSINQAKVYLSIVKGTTCVGEIAKQTQLHRQDIYKILPKLEKMGLITRTLDKPFQVKAIAIENALDNLIAKEKEKANDRIACLENHLKEVVNLLQAQAGKKEPVDAQFTLLTTDHAIENLVSKVFNEKREVNTVTNLEFFTRPIMRHYKQFLKDIPKNKAKSSIIFVTLEEPEKVRKIIEQSAPNVGALTVKLLNLRIQRQYQIIDRKEVCISVQPKTETGFPCMLWTNDKNIVEVYIEHFNKIWNHPQASILYQVAPIKEVIKLKAAQPKPVPLKT